MRSARCELWRGHIDVERGAVPCGKMARVYVHDDAGGGGAWLCEECAREVYADSVREGLDSGAMMNTRERMQ